MLKFLSINHPLLLTVVEKLQYVYTYKNKWFLVLKRKNKDKLLVPNAVRI